MQFGQGAGGDAPLLAALLCAAVGVSLWLRVAPQFTADGAGAAPEQLGNVALAVALLGQ